MTAVRATFIGDRAILPRVQLERLVALARRVEEVDLTSSDEDLSPLSMTLVSEQGGAFDWLAEEPDLYSVDDLKAPYQ